MPDRPGVADRSRLSPRCERMGTLADAGPCHSGPPRCYQPGVTTPAAAWGIPPYCSLGAKRASKVSVCEKLPRARLWWVSHLRVVTQLSVIAGGNATQRASRPPPTHGSPLTLRGKAGDIRRHSKNIPAVPAGRALRGGTRVRGLEGLVDHRYESKMTGTDYQGRPRGLARGNAARG